MKLVLDRLIVVLVAATGIVSLGETQSAAGLTRRGIAAVTLPLATLLVSFLNLYASWRRDAISEIRAIRGVEDAATTLVLTLRYDPEDTQAIGVYADNVLGSISDHDEIELPEIAVEVGALRTTLVDLKANMTPESRLQAREVVTAIIDSLCLRLPDGDCLKR